MLKNKYYLKIEEFGVQCGSCRETVFIAFMKKLFICFIASKVVVTATIITG